MSVGTLPLTRTGSGGREGRAPLRKLVAAGAYLLPSLVGVVGFLLIPVVIVVVLSLTKWNLLNPPQFVGLANYSTIFAYDGYGHALLVTVYYFLLNIPAQTVLALLMALLMRRRLPAVGFFRVICLLPYLATPVAMGLVWNWFFQPQGGAINAILGAVGIAGPNWLASTALAMPVIAFVNIWQYVGYNMLFFIAGLQAIPSYLYESAAVDGAGKVAQFFRITLPLIVPSLLFVMVTGAIGSFQVFDTVYVLTSGGPGTTTTVANFLIYQTGFTGFRMGEASAMAVILFVIILAVTVLQFAFLQRRAVYDLA